jgi:hypothetical protein
MATKMILVSWGSHSRDELVTDLFSRCGWTFLDLDSRRGFGRQCGIDEMKSFALMSSVQRLYALAWLNASLILAEGHLWG